MKTFLITGSTGLVGGDVLKALVAHDAHVVVIGRGEPPVSGTSVQWLRGDLAAFDWRLLEGLPPLDAVIHAGAAVVIDAQADDMATYRTVNMEFSEGLFRWCAQQRNVPAVVYISGFPFLHKPLQDSITEDHPLAPRAPYDLSKYWAELALFKYAGASAYRPVALRISSPLGTDESRLPPTVVRRWIEQSRQGLPVGVWGSGSRTQDFVSTGDVAQAVLGAIVRTGASGVYNVASGTSLPMADLATMIAEVFNVPLTLQGSDLNENERWNIVIEKARVQLGYSPLHSSRGAVSALLQSIVG